MRRMCLGFLILISVLMGSVSAADKPVPVVSPRALAMASNNGYYMGLSFGYAITNWADISQFVGRNDSGGFSFIADGGYQYDSYWAIEGGYVYLTKVAGKISSYVLYLGPKVMLPLLPNMDVFAKAGFAYHHYDLDNMGTNAIYSPLFAFGSEYAINQFLSLNMQYVYLGGQGRVSLGGGKYSVPDSHIFLLGMSYLLNF